MGAVIKARPPGKRSRSIWLIRWCHECGRPSAHHAASCSQHPRRADLTCWEEWRDWHLTLNGWERGDSKDIEPIAQRRIVPLDRRLTLRVRTLVNRFETHFAPSLILWSCGDSAAALAGWVRHGPPPDRCFRDPYRDFERRIRAGEMDGLDSPLEPVGPDSDPP